jgi:hypothetical protein
MEGNRRRKKLPPGRPRKETKRDKHFGVRFNAPEYFVAKENAKKAGMKFSVYLREIAIHGAIKARLTKDEWQDVRKLVGVSNNINQAVKLAHEEGLLKALIYFESIRDAVDDFLKKMKDDK